MHTKMRGRISENSAMVLIGMSDLFTIYSCLWLVLATPHSSDSPPGCKTSEIRHQTTHLLTCMGVIPTDVPIDVTSVTIQNVQDWGLYSWVLFEWPNVTSVRIENCYFSPYDVLTLNIFRRVTRLIIAECTFHISSPSFAPAPNYQYSTSLPEIAEVQVLDSFIQNVYSNNRYNTQQYWFPWTLKLSLKNVTCEDAIEYVQIPAYTSYMLSLLNVHCSIDLPANQLVPLQYQYLNFTASVNSVMAFLRRFTFETGSHKMPNLTSMDISNGYLFLDKLSITEIDQNSRSYFPVLRDYYAQSVVSFPCTIYLQKYTFISCIQVKYSEVLTDFFIGCFDPTTVSLLDLANNKITSIDISIVNAFTALQTFGIFSNHIHTTDAYYYPNFFPTLKKFYARKFASLSCSIYVKEYTFMHCINVRFSEKNNLPFERVGCFDPTALRLLDLSDNKITSIDVSFSDAFVFLHTLNISSNYLHTLNGGDGLVMKQMTHLEELYLANNQLRTLEIDLFDNLFNVSVIDLSNNKLDSTLFKIDHLQKLRVLHLDGNNISYLCQSFISQLDGLIGHQFAFSNITFKLGLSRNPFNASACLIKPSLTWIISNKPTMTSWPLYCRLSGRLTTIDTGALYEASELCRWPIYIIIACILSSIALCVVIVCVVYCIWHFRSLHREKLIRKLIQNYSNGKDRGGFPVFLSFCSSDGDFVMDNVFEELNNRLQELLGTHKRCISFGDADFRPGALVIEEMVRCLGICDAVILCISNRFLRSPWCTDETRIAHYYKKPVLLMFLEEVDMKQLEKSIVVLYFMTSCRAKWILKPNGKFELQPAWERLCESVISLMSKARGDKAEVEDMV